MDKKRVARTVYIEDDLVKKLKYLSADEGKPMSTLLEEILREYFLKKQ